MDRTQDPDPKFGSGMNIPIIFLRAWKQFFGLNIKFFDAEPDLESFELGSGIENTDPG
jgi:hypothetical protein